MHISLYTINIFILIEYFYTQRITLYTMKCEYMDNKYNLYTLTIIYAIYYNIYIFFINHKYF